MTSTTTTPSPVQQVHELVSCEKRSFQRRLGYEQPLQVRLFDLGNGLPQMRCCLIAVDAGPGGPIVVTGVGNRWPTAIRRAFFSLRRQWLQTYRREIESA